MSLFRYWNSTTCIRSDNLDAIAQAITHLLEQEEGCHRLEQLPPLQIDPEQLRSEPRLLEKQLWIVCLAAGCLGWTIIKTSPKGLLCQRADGANRPRLSACSELLGCDAFHFQAYPAICGVLLEVDATGRTLSAGTGIPEEISNYQFYKQPIDLPDRFEQFSLIQVPESMQAAMKVNENLKPQFINEEDEFVGEEDVECMEYTERIDCALAKLLDNSQSWFLHDLAYYACAHPEKLPAGARLLYFQAAANYQLLYPYTLSEY